MGLREDAGTTSGTASVYPRIYAPVFENDYVQVMRVKIPPGIESEMLFHPNCIVYVIAPSVVALRTSNGAGSVMRLRSGQVIWLEAGRHSMSNKGLTVFEALVVEIK